MPATPMAQTLTAEEFIDLPVPEHGRPWNLVEGEVSRSPGSGRARAWRGRHAAGCPDRRAERV
ncbi:MAG: hypothetical protein ACREX8_00735, partial [Gammaproteobacteria bacterium]